MRVLREAEAGEQPPGGGHGIGLVVQRVREEGGEEHAVDVVQLTDLERERLVGVEHPQPLHALEAVRFEGVQREPVTPARRERLGQLGHRLLERPRGVEEAPRSGVAPLDHVEQLRGELSCPPCAGPGLGDPVEERRGRSPAGQRDGGVEGEGEDQLVGRPAGQPHLLAVDAEPATLGGRRVPRRRDGRHPAAQLRVPDLQQRRRDERGGQDDEEQRGVEVVAEHTALQPDGGEDQADLATGQHAQPDERLVARAQPIAPERGDELPHHRDDEQDRRVEEHRALGRRRRRRRRCRSGGRRRG